MTISRGVYTCQTTVLVQKDAPLDLLVGTDLLSSLGFRLVEVGEDGQAVDLLQQTAWTMSPVEHGESSNPSELPTTPHESYRPVIAEVRLLSAVRVPAHHGRPVGPEWKTGC